MIYSEKARDELKKAFPFTERCTQYIARYETESGKELALERDRKDAYYVWVQKYDTSIPGIRIKNRSHPGQPYDRKQTRNSNLNDTNTPKLKLGNKVWYLEIEDLDALKNLISWYQTV